jgi:hypothetical protein
MDVNQPPTTWPLSPAEPDRDGELALEEPAVRLHHQLAQADPAVRAAEEPEPLGRRLPAALDATRQGVER